MGPGARRAFACRTVLAATLVGLAIGRAATAAEPELTLAWQAPAGCPASADVEAQFGRLLGGAARAPSGKHIEASVLVRASSPDTWTLELATVLDGAVGRRSLAGDSCASVSSAAALILALMIDPAAAERAVLAPAPPAPAAAPPVRARPPEAVVTAGALPPTAPSWGAFARVFGGAAVGLLPGAAPSAGLALGARRGRFAGELLGAATDERREGAAADAGDFRLLVVGARACGALGGRAVVWQLCAGGELERLTGAGVTSPAHDAHALMGASTAGVLVTVPLGRRVGLTLDVDGALRLYHPSFSKNGVAIFQIPAASAFVAGGLVITI
jgi:hypothetical protein